MSHREGRDAQEGRQEHDRVQERGDDAHRGDVAQIPEGRRIGEIEAQESDDGRDAGDHHRQEVDPQALPNGGALVHAVAHQGQDRHEQVDAVGDAERHDDDRGREGNRIERHAGVAREAERAGGRQGHDQQRSGGPGHTPQDDDHEDDQGHEHARYQRQGVALTGFGEGIVEHRDARQRHAQARVAVAQLASQVTRMAHRRRHFGQALFRVLEGDVDAGGARIGGDEVAAQERFTQRDVAAALELGRRQGATAAHQVLDGEIIAIGPGVLKVGDRVDADRIRDLPGLRREPLEGIDQLGLEDRALAGLDHEEDIVVLRVGVLEVIERDQLGVLRTEKDAVVVRERQEAGPATGTDRQEERGGDDHPRAPRHETAKTQGHAVSETECVRTHCESPWC